MRKKQTTKSNGGLPFGKILAALMKERGLTLKQVAEMSTVKISVVSDWTAGAAPRDLKAVSRLARALGVSFQSLLLGETDEATVIKSIPEIFEESELFEGYCKVSIKKLGIRKLQA
jgi:transcriptional regulator with XRE-family HTH domain